jgi:hypothetical protein
MEALEKLGPQVPGLVALIVIIPMFLKAFSKQREESQIVLRTQIDSFLAYMKEQRESWLKEMRELHNEHIDARRSTNDALEKQMELARDTARGNMEMAMAITHLADSVKNCPLKK